jgi:flagellar hook-basal body complex protein FliE
MNSSTSSSLQLADQQVRADYEKAQLRTATAKATPTKVIDEPSSPGKSLAELELHTSAFFDAARLRHHGSSTNKEQQRRNRASAMPDTTRYYSSSNSKTNSSTPSRPVHRRPLSLSLENQQQATNPTDYYFMSTSEATSPPAVDITSMAQPYSRRSRRTVSPTSSKNAATHIDHNRLNSPPSSYRYSMRTSPDATRRTTSPMQPTRYLVSYDFDNVSNDLKRKPANNYVSTATPTTNELNVVPSLSNSSTPMAPSVFTTSSIKFAPASARLMSPSKDQDNTMNTARSFNATLPNSLSNLDQNQLNATNRRSLFDSVSSPLSSKTNLRKSRQLDDNNNFVSSQVHD